MLISFPFFACHFWWAKRKILCEKYISYIFHVFSEARDHILILKISFLYFLYFSCIFRSERPYFNSKYFILQYIKANNSWSKKWNAWFTYFYLHSENDRYIHTVHSAGYLILRNEVRSTQEIARQNIQVSLYILSMGLCPNTWIHVSQYLAIIRNAMHILWPVN